MKYILSVLIFFWSAVGIGLGHYLLSAILFLTAAIYIFYLFKIKIFGILVLFYTAV